MKQPGQTIILGISCFYHDSAAAILVDGVVAAAAQEERFTRKKHDQDFPAHAINFCLKSLNLSVADLDHVAFYDKPITKFERLLQTYFKVWPRGLKSFVMAMKVWLKDKLWIEQMIAKKLGYSGPILFAEHHYSHAASAYYCSDFDEAVVVTMDGVGEWDTTTIGYGRGNKLELTEAVHFPHSLGLLYSALTYYLGFKVNSAEYKVMGLAPYGNPDVYYGQFKELITVKDDGSYRLNMKYFSYEYGLKMTNRRFDRLFGEPPRNPESPLEQRHKDIAAALQKVTEEVVLKIVQYARLRYPAEYLCLAGGVALNCVANGKILRTGWFKDIYIQPAAGDAGGAIGAACYVYYDALKHPKQTGVMPHAFLGPEFNNEEIKSFLDIVNQKIASSPLGVITSLARAGRGDPLVFQSQVGSGVKGIATSADANRLPRNDAEGQPRYRYVSDDNLCAEVAKLIAGTNVVGWFQGRMEFGPRALGNRSIIADARHKENWQKVNLKIKYRESFRPFAPTVLQECADEYFDLRGQASPYMLLVAQSKKDTVPAVTHVDGSARIQTINRLQNARYYDLINEFYKLTGCPVIINTSFNVRGEPIVCSPADAFNCFVNTEMDYLVLGNYIISKIQNPFILQLRKTEEYLKSFVLD